MILRRLRSLSEIDLDQTPCEALAPRLVHVREDRHVPRDGEADDEGGFDSRLIPAREAAPRVNGLELRRAHCLLLPREVGVGRAVEAGHLVVQATLKFDVEGAGADRDRGGKIEGLTAHTNGQSAAVLRSIDSTDAAEGSALTTVISFLLRVIVLCSTGVPSLGV